MKRALIYFLLTAPLVAQQTVVQQLFVNNADGVVTTPTTLIKNVGQIGHLVSVQLTNATGQTCPNNGSVDVNFQVSFDGSTWTNIATQTSTGQSAVLRATAIANYYRVFADWSNPDKCLGSGWYNATTAAPMELSVDGSAATGTAPGNPVYVGGTSNGLVRPIITCTGSTPFSVTAGNSVTVTTPLAGQNIHICSVVVSMSSAGTFQLGAVTTGGNCSTAPALTPSITLAQGIPLVMGGNLGEVLEGGLNFQICASATGGTAAGIITFTSLGY